MRFILFTVFVMSTTVMNAQWVQTNGPYSWDVRTIAIDGSSIYAGTFADGIFLSNDNGNTWSAVNSGLTDLNVNSICILGSSICAGTGTGIFLSTNNGMNWNLVTIGDVRSIVQNGLLFAADRTRGVIVSSDSGSTWQVTNLGLLSTSIVSLGVQGSTIFAGEDGNGSGTMFRSLDNGNAWAPVFSDSPDYGWITISASGNFIFASIDVLGRTYRSIDNGINWELINIGTLCEVYSIFINSSGIYAATSIGLLLSNNLGDSWNSVLNNGLPSAPFYPQSIAIQDYDLFVGTVGAGVWQRHLSTSLIFGRIYNDQDSNCVFNSSDAGLSKWGHSYWMVKASGPNSEYYSVPDSSGFFKLIVDSGNYVVSLVNPSQVHLINCPISGTYPVSVISFNDSIDNIDFSLSAQISCSRMNTSITSSLFRPCRSSILAVDYCNEGTIPETSAVVKVILPQELSLTNSSIPYNSVTGNTYSFNIGTVNEGECGSFTISADVLCNPVALVNATLCVRSEITPAEFCSNQPQDTTWDKSSVKVTGTCQGDTLICFRIWNSGSNVNGNMQGPSQWRLYADNVLVQQGTFQLLGQQDTVMCFIANWIIRKALPPFFV